MYANIASLNGWRRKRGFSKFYNERKAWANTVVF